MVSKLMFRLLPIQILFAVPLTEIFYRDPSQPVYMMTVWGFRLIPLCMPLSVICNHFVCYGQASGKQGLVQVLSLQDGGLGVVVFSALLIGVIGMRGVFLSSLCNGIVTTAIIIAYAWIRNRRMPKDLEELMVIPEDFGVAENERMDLAVHSMDEVISISERVHDFCRERGIDEKRAYLAALSMEEMAGNVVLHGFTKDRKTHSIDVRIVHKDDRVILRLRDDCVPFDPGERQYQGEGDDILKNIGIRMIFGIADDIQYQNILGLNVLTVRC